ncbi:DapH/DapD/GlmU-related protein [Nitrospira sp. NS4]|uniref:DapH/DapD/GlmU-related protein n=1 Tax=Nitrospira sp. NS4 TaxID=3414498 RepID=UPI003C2F297F
MIEGIAELVVWLCGGFWKLRERIAGCKFEPLRQLYLLLYYLYLRKFGSFIGHTVKFSTRPCFPHGFHGVFIAGGTKIGENCVIFHHVTIGANPTPFSKTTGIPTIGDNCYIGVGAVIIGAVKIGHNCRIGANCTVASDIPDNSVVVSSQARIITKTTPPDNRYFRWSPKGPVYFKDGKWILETDKAVIDNLKNAL